MNGDVPFVRESEAEYLIAISDRNIMWRILTEEIEGKAFGTHSILPLQKGELDAKIKFTLHKAFVVSVIEVLRLAALRIR